MDERCALTGADIFTGEEWSSGHALVLKGRRVEAIVPADAVEPGIERVRLDGGLLAPGFVDLQVNGGGGVLLNERPDIEGIAAICAAHAGFGTTALLPTVITDRPRVTMAAIAAVGKAVAAGVPGCLGIHVEGPFIDLRRKGAHDAAFIRAMEEGDVEALAAATVRPMLVTLAPESATPERIRRLVAAGIHVSLGHSDCSFEDANAAFGAGARMATHLFNAMSPLTHRAPGLVGAALDGKDVWCGVIADGHHVHPAALRLALRAKPGRIFAVSDAMSTVGSPGEFFTLNGRRVTRDKGRLTLEDGTLAGSDIAMIDAVRHLAGPVGVPLDEALRMASLYPAMALGIDGEYGRLTPGARADIVHLGDGLHVRGIWIGGARQG